MAKVTAVVLAAGESRRMGKGTSKQLLPWGDTTVLGQTLQQVRQSQIDDVLVVTGHQAHKVAAVARAHGARVVHNPEYARGEMLSSLQKAVSTLPPECDAVLVILADQPMVPSQTYDTIVAAYHRGGATLVAPTFEGRRGNPVLIARALFQELLELPYGEAPRTLLRRHPEQLQLVEVESDAVLRDLDRPEQYERQRPNNE
ncbi:MAG: nucleotidyltransferase family protein [Chloroflexota bacterium]